MALDNLTSSVIALRRPAPLIAAVGVIVSALLATAMGPGAMTKSRKGGSIRAEAVFSPGGGCESRIVEELSSAKKNIRIQMYIFTSKRIAEVLGKAAKRGVKVDVILDKSQEKATYGPWRVLRRDGVRVYFDREHDTANNKIAIVDSRAVITGSYNFTKAAEDKNAENILILKNADDVIDSYIENFERHLEHAKKAS
ncbi:hypothetical protein B7486_09310 [cyanobacterium TDX16]|nr:hypothetical protein B7486_09310 [cyanobacterium TDX16]